MTGRIYLDTTEYSVSERDPFVNITIRRDGDTSGAVNVTYSTNADTATAGEDYVTRSGTVTIPAGAESVIVQVPIINDGLSEPTEQFNLSLINVDSGTLLLPRTTNVSILDDENPVIDPPDPAQTSPYTVTLEDAATNLHGPMQIEWLPDSNLALVSEKAGRIQIVDFDSGETVSTLLDITSKVNSDADRGLLDIALHPDLQNNPYLYAFYVVDPDDSPAFTANDPASQDNLGNRYAHLVRYELDLSGDTPTIKPNSETIMLGGAGQSLADISGNGKLDFTDPVNAGEIASDVDPQTGEYKQDYIKVDSRSHAGGSIAFGPDGALYVGIGDGSSYNYADPRTKSVQDVDSLAGKVLRIDPITGEGFADNPYATDDLGENASKVWQMGLRNPYAMTFTEDGRVMISETGWYSWEEINSGEKGANFGWPYFEGADNGESNRTPNYQSQEGAAEFYAAVERGDIVITPAFRAFSHTASDPGFQMSAIVGGTTVYDGDKYPDVFHNDYFFSDIVDGDIFTVDVNDRTKLQYVTNIGTYHAVSFVQGPDGYVYYADLSNNKIVRMVITDPNEHTNHAPALAAPIADQSATEGQDFTFKVPGNTFTDLDGDALTFHATLADGSALPDWLHFSASTGTFTGTPPDGAAGELTVRVTAIDPSAETATDDFVITINDLSGPAETVVADIASANQFVEGTTANDVFEFAGPSSQYQWGPTEDGKGIVVWTRSTTDDSFDVLTGFEKLRFSDRTISLVEDNAGPDYRDDPGLVQQLTGTTNADRFIINGPSTDYAWGDTLDGKGIVIWTTSGTDDSYDILNGFEQLVFTDKVVYLNGEPPANTAPVVTDPIEDQTAIHTWSFNFTLPADTFTDADGDSLTLSAKMADGTTLPGWLSFDAATRTFSGTVDGADIGKTLAIEVTASDGHGGTVSDIFDIDVVQFDRGPRVMSPIADQDAAAGDAYDFVVPAGTFYDNDQADLVYSASLADGSALPDWLSFDAATRTFSGTPTSAGTFEIKVTATDPGGRTGSDVFQITVAADDNAAPVVTDPIEDQTAIHTWTFNLTLPADTFTDPDGDTLTLSARMADGSALPGWLSFDAATRTFSGVVDGADIGKTLAIEVTASDGHGGMVSDIFDIDVVQFNRGPRLVSPIADQDAAAGDAYDFTVPVSTFYDEDQTHLVYSATLADGSALPDWLSFDPATLTFSGTPTSAGTFEIRVTATDTGGLTGSDVFSVTVAAHENEAPVVNDPIEDSAGTAGEAFSFTISGDVFTDAEDTHLNYTAARSDGSTLPGWLNFDAATGTFSGTPDESAAGTYTIRVTATDSGGLSVSDDFRLTIAAPPTEETHYQNTAANQYLEGGEGTDVFVLGGKADGFGWGPTNDGKGVVIWDSKGFDILFGFEELRFTDKSVAVSSIIGNGSPEFHDDPDTTQYLVGNTADDRFLIDADSSDYHWGPTEDGHGVVVWRTVGDDTFDILTGFDTLVFQDREIDISDIGHA